MNTMQATGQHYEAAEVRVRVRSSRRRMQTSGGPVLVERAEEGIQWRSLPRRWLSLAVAHPRDIGRHPNFESNRR